MPVSPAAPRLAMSPVTIAQCGFTDAMRVTAEAGFAGIGLRYNQLEDYLAHGGTLAEVKALAAGHGLSFAEAAFLAEWQFHGGLPVICRRQRTGGADEDEALLRQRLERFLQHCEALECANVTAVPAIRERGDLDRAAEEFGRLCDLARPYGVRLCLEFIGSAVQVKDIETAGRLVAAAGRANGGLLVDTFLFHEGGSRLSSLDTVPVDQVFNVQLADARPLPRDQLNMLEDRLFPGEGAAPVREIVTRLSQRGYDGWWTVELFNPDYRAMEPLAVARRALACARAMFSQPVDRVAAGAPAV